MRELWSITVEDYEEVVRRATEAGLEPGESMEAIFIDYMVEKGQKSFARTELNNEELLSDLTHKNKNILKIDIDTKGKSTYRVMKKKGEPNI
jgi:hypothetical protein